MFLKGLEKLRKGEVFGIGFLIFISLAILEVFPRVFLWDFDFQTLYFLTLELIYLSYLLGSSLWENWFVVVDTTKCCKPFFLCDIPLVRGDCVDIPLVRGGGCVVIPLSEEVIVELWLCAYPQL